MKKKKIQMYNKMFQINNDLHTFCKETLEQDINHKFFEIYYILRHFKKMYGQSNKINDFIWIFNKELYDNNKEEIDNLITEHNITDFRISENIKKDEFLLMTKTQMHSPHFTVNFGENNEK